MIAKQLLLKKAALCNAWDNATRHEENVTMKVQSSGDDLMRWMHEASYELERMMLNELAIKCRS